MVSLPAMLLAAVLSSSSETVLLEFTADWCGPCRTMEPTLRRLHDEGYPIQVVNVDRQPDLARRFNVGSIPCFVLVANGREVNRLEGTCSHDRLVELFRQGGLRPSSGLAPPANRLTNARSASPGLPAQAAPTRRAAEPSSPDAVPHTPPMESVARSGGSLSSQLGTPVTRSIVAAGQAADAALTPEQRALRATVRLKVIDDRGHSFATGTIIDTHGDEALVLTCGHVFRESRGKGQIVVDLFVPGAAGPVPGQLVSYEAEQRDIGLVSIRPSVPVVAVRVASVNHHPREGDSVFSLGCDHGEEPSIRPSQITAIDRYMGPPNLEIAGHPVDGRSGGGLFTADGRLIGICNSADMQEDRGIYAALRTIHLTLKQTNLEHICLDDSTPAAPVLQEIVQDSPPAASMQPVPVPVDLPKAQRLPGDTEVICILRSRSQPQAENRVLVIDQPSAVFMQQLSRESERIRGPDNQMAGLPSAQGPPPSDRLTPINRGPILRAQNSR